LASAILQQPATIELPKPQWGDILNARLKPVIPERNFITPHALGSMQPGTPS
jgi:hypothetical protein